MSAKPAGALVALLPVGALVVSMASIQVGAALAQQLFPAIGAQGTTALRVCLAAVILLAVRRPSLKGLTWAQGRSIALYGVVLGAMNLAFYMALRTIPLGVAVAVEFTGPLVVAVASHRDRLDILWLGLAAVGLLALAPLGQLASGLDPGGLGLALAAGLFWGLYILFGQKAGAAGGGAATALGMLVASAVVLPFGLAHAGAKLFNPALLPIALTVAVLSSALPYTLEMFALTRLPRATFGALMSLEPAIGALSGWLLLGQRLDLRQGLAIACIIAASAGAAATLVKGQAGPVQPP